MRTLAPDPKGYPRQSSIARVCDGLIYSKPWQREDWSFDKTKVIHQRRTRQASPARLDLSGLL